MAKAPKPPATTSPRGLTRPQIEFGSEQDLLQFSLKVLVDAGCTVEQIDRLRNRAKDPSFTFSPEITGQRRYMTSELLAAGLSNGQIAQVFRQSKDVVNTDRQAIRALYTKSILQTADNWRAKLLQEQDDIRRVAMEGFSESKRRKVVRRKLDAMGEDDDDMDSLPSSGGVTEDHYSAGDSSFLRIASSCLVEQAKLLGLHNSSSHSADDEKGYKKWLSKMGEIVDRDRENQRNALVRADAIDASAEPMGDAASDPADA